MKKRITGVVILSLLAVLLTACDFSEEINRYLETVSISSANSVLETEGNQAVDEQVIVPKTGVEKWWTQEEFYDEYDEKASEVIDESIKTALNAVFNIHHDAMSDSVKSMSDRPFEDDLRVYNSYIERRRNLFDLLVGKGRQMEDFKVKEKEYGPELVVDYLTIGSEIEHFDPFLESYYGVSFEKNDLVSVYYDPDMNMNYEVSKGTAEYEEMIDKIGLFKAVIRRAVRKMPEGLSTYDKYYYLATVVATQAEYNSDFSTVKNCSTAYGCLIGKKCLCEGYSKAFLLLCKEANLYCRLIIGFSGDEGHMWNVVSIDGAEYHFDATWASGCELGSIRYDTYMGMNNEECTAQNHQYDENLVDSGAPLW